MVGKFQQSIARKMVVNMLGMWKAGAALDPEHT